jgi:hypothetical protein
MAGSNARWSKAAKSTAGLAPGEKSGKIHSERYREYLSGGPKCEDLGQMWGFCRFSQRIANIVDCLLERVEFEPSGDFFLNGQ